MKTMTRTGLRDLLEALRRRGFVVVGPTIRDNAIVYDELNSPEDLPIGWTDEQSGGTYRLKKRGDEACFGYNVGPQSWKQYLYPPSLRLWSARRTHDGFQVNEQTEEVPAYALFGVRSCELHAIAVHDRVFTSGKFVDPSYEARRERIFTVAVNCAQAGGTCFCVSMDTGPRASSGFDLALTEIIDGAEHYFTVEVGSERGADVLAEIPHEDAGAAEERAADAAVARAAASMGRELDTTGIKELLQNSYTNPRWDATAKRCLTCGNCTQVCPTCFCSTVEDTTSLDGTEVERVRKWDSCFTLDFSYIHGGYVRQTTSSRYRQWLTHKLANWVDQFGTSGCVGCGRCITWCPVGIDITEEVRAIREAATASAGV
jgi:ferredoxin